MFTDEELFEIYDSIFAMSVYWRITLKQFSKDFPNSAKIKSKVRRSKKYQSECFRLKRERRIEYAKPRLLIIDEWLATKPDANDLHAIKELIHRRRRKSSTIFCSQVLKDGWYQALGGEDTEAEAILDRIAYDGYTINIEYADPDNALSMRQVYNHLKPLD